MARLKIEKTDEYEVYTSYKEFLVTVDEQEFKILKKNRTVRVLKKIDRDGEIPTYIELRGKEIGDLMRSLKPSNLGRRLPRIPLPSPSYRPPPVPYVWIDSDSPEDDTSESNYNDESISVLYESEYAELFEGLDDSDW